MRALIVLIFALVGVLAGYDSNSKSNIAVYWGQNSKGDQGGGTDAQKPLLEYCKSGDIDILILAFVIDPITAWLGISAQGEYCSVKDGVQDCSKLGEDIKKCQKEHQKTILLSIGGSRGAFGFTDENTAIASAQLLWNAFGSSNSSPTASRPFGDAAIDGFDIDIENPGKFHLQWAFKLRELTEGKALLTGAPMCRGPDPGKQPMDLILADDLLDIVFVQFYNDNACEPLSSTFNFGVWDSWAKGKTKKKTRVFMGLAAGPLAGTGYVSPDKLDIVDRTKNNASFGGVMLWDASQSWANENYHKKVREHLL